MRPLLEPRHTVGQTAIALGIPRRNAQSWIARGVLNDHDALVLLIARIPLGPLFRKIRFPETQLPRRRKSCCKRAEVVDVNRSLRLNVIDSF
jgi:hypothetical protein